MSDQPKVGDRVEWTHLRRVYQGYELTLRTGTVESIRESVRGCVATIKPPKKHARRINVYCADLAVVNTEQAAEASSTEQAS